MIRQNELNNENITFE